MKNVKKSRPCKDCPFRSDRPFYLDLKKKMQIANGILRDDFFPCHRTNLCENPNPDIPCKGAAKFIEIVRGDYRTNVNFRVRSEFLGEIDDSVPVYKTLEEFLAQKGVEKYL